MTPEERIEGLQSQVIQLARAIIELRWAIATLTTVTQPPADIFKNLDNVGVAINKFLATAEGKKSPDG